MVTLKAHCCTILAILGIGCVLAIIFGCVILAPEVTGHVVVIVVLTYIAVYCYRAIFREIKLKLS